jgi:mono/diheme cytochrome c family protein
VRRSLVIVLATAILLAGCSLAGDVTPPPALATQQAAEPVALAPTESAQTSPPDTRPDPSAGETIYQTRCAPCHGVEGLGDGEQAASLSNPPSPLGDQEFARTAKPADWYTVVTQGRMDRFMPPFTSLTDEQRWDVVAYALTLSTNEASLGEGEQAYADTCASCHGSSGEGTARGPALNTTTFMADHTSEDVFAAATDGVGGDMPGFAAKLSEDQRWATAEYVRTLAFGTTLPEGNAETAPVAPAASGSIRGQATNGTTGEPLTGDYEVNLVGFDADAQAVDTSTKLGSDGSFAFDGLDIVPGRIFGVTLQYKGVVYFSDAAHLSQDSPDVTLPLVVYDTTTDASQVTVDRLHLIFDFPGGDVVRILELWVLSNHGDATVVGEGDQGAVVLPLPPGATNLGLPGDTLSQDIHFTDQGAAVLAPVMPGSGTGQIVFNFDLPYKRSLDFTQSMAYPVSAVIALLPDGGPKLTGSGWQDLGVQNIGGDSYQSLSLEALSSGQTLAFSLSGQASATAGGGVSTSNLAIGLGVLGLTLVAVGLWWYRPWQRPAFARVSDEGPTREGPGQMASILQQIADLDEAFEAGEMDEPAYHRRREALKARALALRRTQDD